MPLPLILVLLVGGGVAVAAASPPAPKKLRLAGLRFARPPLPTDGQGNPIVGPVRDDPNALYVAAIANLANKPDLGTILSPIAAAVFNAAKKELVKLGEKVATAVVETVESGLISALGPEIAQEIAGIVGDVAAGVGEAIPFIGAIIAVIDIGVSLDAQAHEAARSVYRAEAANAVGRAVVPTGYGGIGITPTDIFAKDLGEKPYVGSDVHSSLGQFIVAASEDDGVNVSPPSLYDAPLSHSIAALDPNGPPTLDFVYGTSLPAYWRTWSATNGLAGQSKVGLLPEDRKSLALMRRAMSAQPLDRGASIWPLYLDYWLYVIDEGRMTPNYAGFLASFYFRDPMTFASFGPPWGVVPDLPMGANPMGDGSPGPYASGMWGTYVDQWWAMLANWRIVRADPKNLAKVDRKLMRLRLRRKRS